MTAGPGGGQPRKPGDAESSAESCATAPGDAYSRTGRQSLLTRQLTVLGRVFAFADGLIRPEPHPRDRRLARRVQERLPTGHRISLGATSAVGERGVARPEGLVRLPGGGGPGGL
ncbi:hypothetical protein ACWC09_32470 [Streptomyces sp. NPDC001617]